MNVRNLIHILTLFSVAVFAFHRRGNTVLLPKMHLKAVKDYGWMTDAQFADVFAISQAAPGPSILIVTWSVTRPPASLARFCATQRP